MQLNADFTKAIQVNAGASPAATATELLKAISKAEADFQANLDKSYETMNENTFKALRRILPITRTKIDWEKIHKYKLGVEAVVRPCLMLSDKFPSLPPADWKANRRITSSRD